MHSAGAGRTGTFIAFDILKAESKRENSVDVFNCILKMREQRVDMVQSEVSINLRREMGHSILGACRTTILISARCRMYVEVVNRTTVAIEPGIIRVLTSDHTHSTTNWSHFIYLVRKINLKYAGEL